MQESKLRARSGEVNDASKPAGGAESYGLQGHADRLRPEVGLSNAPDGRSDAGNWLHAMSEISKACFHGM